MWRIVEATIAILLLAGTLFFLISKQETNNSGFDAFQLIKPIVNEVAKNISIREAILSDTYTTNSAENTILEILSNKLSNPSFGYNVTICDAFTNNSCGSSGDYPSSAKELYSEERIISATLTSFSPKILKIYLWRE